MKSLICSILMCGLLLVPTSGFSLMEPEEEECSQEVLFQYFPAPFVRKSLEKFNVPQGKWEAIIVDLAGKDDEIVILVAKKAEQQDPNPLKDSEKHQEAIELFRETLLEVFTHVMKQHGIYDQDQIEGMLNDIQKQKAELFAKCMEERGRQVMTPQDDGDSRSEEK